MRSTGNAIVDSLESRARPKTRADNRTPDKNLVEITEEVREDTKLYEEFYSVLGELAPPVYVVPGNMDAPKSLYFSTLEKAQKEFYNIYSIHQRHETIHDFIFAGFGGEITASQNEDFFVAMYEKDEVIKGLLKAPKIIYVTHTPPICYKVDMEKEVHKGCQVVNEVLERLKPVAHFCGHAHNGRGSEKIGNTTIVNPGAFKSGNFALVDIDEQSKQVNIQFKNCHLMK